MLVRELVLQGLALGAVGRLRVRSAEGGGLLAALCSESPRRVLFRDPGAGHHCCTVSLVAEIITSRAGLARREGSSGP